MISFLSHPRVQAWRRRTGGVVLFIAGSAMGAWGWQHFMTPHDPQLDTVIEAWHMAQSVYVRPVSEVSLRDGALAGMAQSLDPHSEWWAPKDQSLIAGELSGQYGGVGIRFRWTDHGAMLENVKAGGPADRAGLRKGDLIIAVNGHTIDRRMTLSNAWRGKPGSVVVMTIQSLDSKGATVHHDVTMKREIIQGFGVDDDHKALNGQANPWIRVRVEEFQESTVDEAAGALRRQWALIHEEGHAPAGIVLDLRGSPGGLVQTSLGLSSLLMGPGKTVVMIRERVGQQVMKTIDFPTESWSSWAKTAPVIVWTDHGTASAAEIMVAALRDHGRAAWIIGEPTFGKGSVQSAIPLIKDGDFKITTGLYTGPNGEYLQGVGEVPDVWIKPVHPQDPQRLPAEKNLPGYLEMPKNLPLPLGTPRTTLTVPDAVWSDTDTNDTWFWKVTALALQQAPSAAEWKGTSFPSLSE